MAPVRRRGVARDGLAIDRRRSAPRLHDCTPQPMALARARQAAAARSSSKTTPNFRGAIGQNLRYGPRADILISPSRGRRRKCRPPFFRPSFTLRPLHRVCPDAAAALSHVAGWRPTRELLRQPTQRNFPIE